MNILKKIAITLVLLVVLAGLAFVALGIFLPNEITTNNQIEINASPEEIWQVMEDREKYIEWTPNIEKVEIISENKWKEIVKGSDVPIVFESTNLIKPSKYQLKYEMKDMMKGEWTGSLEKTESGTLLKTEDKVFNQSWMSKIFMPLFFDLDAFAKEFNQRLKDRAENLNY